MGFRGTDKPFADLQTANNNEQGHELSSPPAYSEHSFNSSPAYTAHSGLYQQEGAVPKDPPPPYTNIGIVDSHAHPTLQPLITQPQAGQRNQPQRQPSAANHYAPSQASCCEVTDDACTACMCCCLLCQICE